MSSSTSSDYHSHKSAESSGKAHHVRRIPMISMTVHNVYSPTAVGSLANSHTHSVTKPSPRSAAFVSHSRHAPLVHFARKDEKLRPETKHVPSRPPSPYPGKRKQSTTTLSGPAQTKEVSKRLVPPKLDTLHVPPR